MEQLSSVPPNGCNSWHQKGARKSTRKSEENEVLFPRRLYRCKSQIVKTDTWQTQETNFLKENGNPQKDEQTTKRISEKARANLLKKSEKSRANYKKTREKVRANHENNTSKSTSKPQTPEKNTSKPLKKHEQTIKKTLEKGRANHKHKHQKKHGPRARENWKKHIKKNVFL